MFNYDPEGRPVLFLNPDGSVAQKHYYAPNGRLVRTEDSDYAQVPHEAIIPLEFQAGGGFRDLETAPRSAAAKHFHLTVGGYVTSGMVYLGLDLSREQQEAFGGAINAAPGKIYDCTVSIAKFLRNLTAGALDGLAHGFTGGLYEGQLAGTFLGAEVDSAAYLTGHVVASFVGPIALSMAAGGIGNPWLLRAAIAVDVMGIIDGIHKRSVLGVVGGLIGLRMGVKAYRSAMSSAGRRVALEAIESGVGRGRNTSNMLANEVDPLLDANMLSWIAEGNRQATAFANAKRGLLSTSATAFGEAAQGAIKSSPTYTSEALAKAMVDFEIKLIVQSKQELLTWGEHARMVVQSIKGLKDHVKLNNDFYVIGAALANKIPEFATGDYRCAWRAAKNSGITKVYLGDFSRRPLSQRISTINKWREQLLGLLSSKMIDPSEYSKINVIDPF